MMESIQGPRAALTLTSKKNPSVPWCSAILSRWGWESVKRTGEVLSMQVGDELVGVRGAMTERTQWRRLVPRAR